VTILTSTGSALSDIQQNTSQIAATKKKQRSRKSSAPLKLY
jgi:hypothetical protein